MNAVNGLIYALGPRRRGALLPASAALATGVAPPTKTGCKAPATLQRWTLPHLPMLLQPRSPVSLFLYGQPWFESLEVDARSHVIDQMVMHKGCRGSTLLAHGTPVQGWYAVLSGLVKLQTSGSDGRVSAFLGVATGEWFGEGSSLTGGHWRYDVIALRDTTLLSMPLPCFNELQATSLAFNQFLVTRMNRRLGQAMAIVEAGRLRSPQERVALHLSRLFWPATRKLNVSQEDIGNLTGLSRQTVNKVLKGFEAQGWVSLKFGRVDIQNEAALESLLVKTPPQPTQTERHRRL